GLSATQRPLEDVARYLGGLRKVEMSGGKSGVQPRPVTIVDAGRGKDLDLEVTIPNPAILPQQGPVWPATQGKLFELIQSHRSTIVFTNNRRVAERLTSHLNELAVGASIRTDDNHSEAVERPSESELFLLARAHHGSLSQEQRRQTEEALKRGELP